jgi:hypothetical protein
LPEDLEEPSSKDTFNFIGVEVSVPSIVSAFNFTLQSGNIIS